MGEEEVTAALREAGILQAVRWAFDSAVSRALDDYVPKAGYDEQWLGETRYVLFRDRLDRVFGCVDYEVRPGEEHLGQDELFAEIPDPERTTMPRLTAGTVYRGNLNNSPGWVFGDWRLLIISGDFGRLNHIPWAQKSPTKQAVARQSGRVDPRQGALFDATEYINQPDTEVGLDKHTFVIAHALHPITHQTELAVGLPRLSSRGDESWHWLYYLEPRPDAKEEAGLPVDTPSNPARPVTDPVVKRRAAQGEQDRRRASDDR